MVGDGFRHWVGGCCGMRVVEGFEGLDLIL